MHSPQPDNRILREQQFHDTRFGNDDEMRRPLEKYYTLMRRPQRRYEEIVLRYGKSKQLLDYGCSTGEASVFWAQHGALTTGIDISGEAIRIAEDSARSLGLDIRLSVMNAEKTQFDDGTFDVVAGTGILHHLDIDSAYREIARVLRDDGHAVFIEPLGHNPFINLYRKLTPSMRSEDEHPLRSSDLAAAKKYFGEIELEFFNITTLLSVPFQSGPLFRPLHGLLAGIDRAMFTFAPFTRRYAWMVLLHLSSPLRGR